ncbi:MAG: DNA polymerase I [Chloroflexi bacterium]|nr:DNA polymerase I [Chloroflexota bacterium]
MSDRPLFYLLDGHALTYRNFYAMGRSGGSFTTSKGEPTSAVFGFARLLLDMLGAQKPPYIAVSFDRGLSGREQLFPAYKATRVEMDAEKQASFDSQLARIEQLVRAFNIPLLALPGYEADDIIGTVTAQAVEQGVAVKIFTGDGDILQLLAAHVRVQMFQTMGGEVDYDIPLFIERRGFQPSQLVDYKALVGDTSDNIPGVKGVGEKTAKALLNTYGTLDAIYEHLADIEPKVRTKLSAARDMAYLSQELARIKRDVPITLDLNACVSHDYDADVVDALFAELEFRSLRVRLENVQKERPQAAPNARIEVVETPAPASAQWETVIVNDEHKLAELVTALNSAQGITFDVESTSTDQIAAELVGIALAVDEQRGYYVPVGHSADPAARADGQMSLESMLQAPRAPVKQLPMQQVLDALRPALTNPNIPKYAHNASYDLVVMQRHGIEVAPITFDTMIAEWVCDPGSRFLGLKDLARQRLDMHMTEISELIGKGKTQITMNYVEIEKAAPYAAADAVATQRLVPLLQHDLVHGREGRLDDGTDRSLQIFSELEMPLVPVIAAIEQAGVLLDVPFLNEMSGRLALRLEELENEIYGLSGGYGRFNINSPKQLNDVLFGKLGLPTAGIAKTTHGFSTAADVLERLAELDTPSAQIVGKILDYREVSKLKSTYVDALPALVNPRTGRVHTSFNQTGTSTGRLSSSNPNLQNIPIRTEFTREIRRGFIAPPGAWLLSADYSQIELRILAHMSGDATLIDAFQRDLDIHAATAAAVFNVPLESVTYEQRNFAKRVNFGLLYGMGAYRLTRESDLSLAESRAFIDRYFQQLPGVRQYHEQTREKLRLPPHVVETLSGRRRYFPIFERLGRINQNDIATAEREAINMPVQGTAADIIKRAMINLYAELRQRRLAAQMILQVHDELLLEVPESELSEVKTLVRQTMENAMTLRVPLRANTQIGKNWKDMEKI